MKYLVVIQKLADDHFQMIKKSGDKSSLRKLQIILGELENHPKSGTGNPEQLKYQLTGFWSRRLNKKDRLIYEIIEEPDKKVVVISALGHY